MAILVWLIVAEALYVRALRVLGRRGVAVPRAQVACWHLGLGLQAVALLSPIGSLADELLSAHMAEHLLLADLGAPLLLAGLRNPVLAFFLPRDVHLRRDPGLVAGAGAEAAAAARRAVEDRPHHRRADGRDVPRDGVRADARAGLHARLRE